MTDQAHALLAEALALPERERAEIASQLLASLDQDEPEDPGQVRRAWAREIERRAERVVVDGPRGEPWADVKARLRARLTQT